MMNRVRGARRGEVTLFSQRQSLDGEAASQLRDGQVPDYYSFLLI